MGNSESTCWTVIQGAAAGQASELDHFARRYTSVIRAYFAARWRTSPHQSDLDDAVQEVFLECFRQGGVLDKTDREWPGCFRPFLYGVTRNVALRIETRAARRRDKPDGELNLDGLANDDESLAGAFDRAWAKGLLREAADLLKEKATKQGADALRRVELLTLRFHEGLPIREIAQRWQADAAQLHQAYGKARQEFKAALREVMAFHNPGSPSEIEKACVNLLAVFG